MNGPRLCPHCGYDLAKDAPIILNDFSMMSPASPLCYRGKALKLSPAEREVIWSILKSYPRPVSIDVILDRIDSDATGNSVDVLLSRVRKKLRDIDAPIPFESARGGIGRRSIVWRTT